MRAEDGGGCGGADGNGAHEDSTKHSNGKLPLFEDSPVMKQCGFAVIVIVALEHTAFVSEWSGKWFSAYRSE